MKIKEIKTKRQNMKGITVEEVSVSFMRPGGISVVMHLTIGKTNRWFKFNTAEFDALQKELKDD